jgi:hypothetical protein
MEPTKWGKVVVVALLTALGSSAQVIEFESNGLRYQALTRNGLTIMLAQLSAPVREYSVLQVAVSNGGGSPQVVKPEDFLFIRENGEQLPAAPARTVVNSLIDRASGGDVVKLITAYEQSIYGNTHYSGTNGYEQRRQSYLAFSSGRVRAAAAASAIAFVQTKLGPGQSTDGAVFYPTAGRPLGNGTIRVRAGGAIFEFPLVSSNQTP